MIESAAVAITTLISNIISIVGYPGIFIFMTMESAFIPIPSELVMPFAGALAAKNDLNLIYSIISGILGNFFGATLAYTAGTKLGEQPIRNITNKYGKYLMLSEKRIDAAIALFEKYGLFSIAIGRLIPGVRVFISLPAGMAKLSYIKFAALTLLGSTIWIGILTTAGYVLGDNWELISPFLRKFNLIVFLAVFVTTIIYIWHLKMPHKRQTS